MRARSLSVFCYIGCCLESSSYLLLCYQVVLPFSCDSYWLLCYPNSSIWNKFLPEKFFIQDFDGNYMLVHGFSSSTGRDVSIHDPQFPSGLASAFPLGVFDNLLDNSSMAYEINQLLSNIPEITSSSINSRNRLFCHFCTHTMSVLISPSSLLVRQQISAWSKQPSNRHIVPVWERRSAL